MVAALNRYWREFPPIDQLAAAYLEYKPPFDPESVEPVSRASILAAAQAGASELPLHLQEALARFSRETLDDNDTLH